MEPFRIFKQRREVLWLCLSMVSVAGHTGLGGETLEGKPPVSR